GMGSDLDIMEYRDGRFERILWGPPGGGIITKIELVGDIDACPCGIRLYGIGSESIPVGMRDWYEYAWDEAAGEFVLVDQGTEEWDMEWW
ncbi:MAG: hypothetical protein EA382_15520, partial [Spirochaetaceae bacterium]